jgi:hypothetical protein
VTGLAAAWAVWPVWTVERIPIQDLPQHLAAIRVIHDLHAPELHFDRFFTLALHRTQYLSYYLTVHLLAYVVGVALANKLFISAALVGTLFAARTLLLDLGRDPRAALFLAPLLWNVHLIMGFVNFVAAIPLAFVLLSLAVRLRLDWTRRRAVLLGAVALVLFYMHVVPFGLAAVAAVACSLGESAKSSLRRLLPFAPVALAVGYWFRSSPAGASVTRAAGSTSSAGTLGNPAALLAEMPTWLVNVVKGPTEGRVLLGLIVLVVTSLVLAAPREGEHAAPDSRELLKASLARRVALLSPVCFVAYFVTPAGHDWIWPIAGRFPLLAAVFFVVAMPTPRRLAGALLPLAAAGLGMWASAHVVHAFRQASKYELAGLTEALGAIPPGERVAGLIFEPGSRFVHYNPYLHAVAYYQAERGGAVMFSFVDFPASPFKFREENRPPRVPPRWEWLASSVRPEPDLAWYGWVLARGGPGSIGQSPSHRLIHESGSWRVFQRVSGTSP